MSVSDRTRGGGSFAVSAAQDDGQMSVADRQLGFWLFLLTFVTYAYFQAGGGWNQNSQFDLTRATGLATQLLPYSTILMLHVPSGALLLYAAISERRTLAGFSAGLAAAMNYLCAPALIIFALTGDRKSRFAAGAIPPLILLA